MPHLLTREHFFDSLFRFVHLDKAWRNLHKQGQGVRPIAQPDPHNPIFLDETKARTWLESQIWPEGPFCPHCGSVGVTKLHGKAHRPGVHQCNDCRRQFTVTVGTLFERSKIPLGKWLMATYLLRASKKGVSTRQLSRMLGVSLKSTWFMMHRIRESLRQGSGPLGGANKVVGADETYVTGKAKNKAFGDPPVKETIVALVERDGSARSFHGEAVNRSALHPVPTREVDRASCLTSGPPWSR
jgi:transposase-like protein